MQRKKREIETKEADVLVVIKMPGETMGQLLARSRNSLNMPDDTKITFAGRLDPLAQGLVLLLRDEKRYEKEAFLALPKSYIFDLVFDIRTDTLDVLGKLTEMRSGGAELTLEKTESDLREILPALRGIQKHTYPLYSSKTVKGIPLFYYARKSISVDVPTNDIEIYSLKLKEVREIGRKDFTDAVEAKINSVVGDFRQDEICSLWRKKSNKLPEVFQVAQMVVECSSGTYVRVLAEKIAAKLGRFGIADNIIRVRIGEFTSEQIIV